MNKIDPNVYEEVNLDDSDYNCSVDFEHMRMIRPWGYYEVLASGPGYLVKRITVEPGKRTSLQWHEERDEDWFVISGFGDVDHNLLDKLAKTPHRVQRIVDIDGFRNCHIYKGRTHRLSNTGTEPLVIIEVQTSGQADGCREDDIHRIEDDYGREVEEE